MTCRLLPTTVLSVFSSWIVQVQRRYDLVTYDFTIELEFGKREECCKRCAALPGDPYYTTPRVWSMSLISATPHTRAAQRAYEEFERNVEGNLSLAFCETCLTELMQND